MNKSNLFFFIFRENNRAKIPTIDREMPSIYMLQFRITLRREFSNIRPMDCAKRKYGNMKIHIAYYFQERIAALSQVYCGCFGQQVIEVIIIFCYEETKVQITLIWFLFLREAR